jgi:DNA-binding GntR family transcriptional regulator
MAGPKGGQSADMPSGRVSADDRAQFGSASDYAYAALREAIVARRFPPGRRMREIELAEWLGVSRTPTRQALSRLEIEGLLSLRPRDGLIVSALDATATEELYEMRAAIEGAAATMAARHASARDIETLTQLVDREADLAKNAAARYQHNLTFHQALYTAAHNRFLVKSLHALHDVIALLGPTTLGVEGRFRDACNEHQRIVRAIAAGDAQRAGMEASDHVLKALSIRKAMLGLTAPTETDPAPKASRDAPAKKSTRRPSAAKSP